MRNQVHSFSRKNFRNLNKGDSKQTAQKSAACFCFLDAILPARVLEKRFDFMLFKVKKHSIIPPP